MKAIGIVAADAVVALVVFGAILLAERAGSPIETAVETTLPEVDNPEVQRPG